jgi:hypothetical protein
MAMVKINGEMYDIKMLSYIEKLEEIGGKNFRTAIYQTQKDCATGYCVVLKGNSGMQLLLLKLYCLMTGLPIEIGCSSWFRADYCT